MSLAGRNVFFHAQEAACFKLESSWSGENLPQRTRLLGGTTSVVPLEQLIFLSLKIPLNCGKGRGRTLSSSAGLDSNRYLQIANKSGPTTQAITVTPKE